MNIFDKNITSTNYDHEIYELLKNLLSERSTIQYRYHIIFTKTNLVVDN